MVPLVRWKNTFVRRVTLIVTLPVLVVVCLIGGAASGAMEWTGDLLAAIPNTWRGRPAR